MFELRAVFEFAFFYSGAEKVFCGFDVLGLPFFFGETRNNKREQLYQDFHDGDVEALIVACIDDEAITCLVTEVAVPASPISSSRFQTRQRAGRIIIMIDSGPNYLISSFRWVNMAFPAEVSSVDTLPLVATLGWALVLGIGVYQYRKGKESREQFYSLATMALFWLSYGVLQFDYLVSGRIEDGIEFFSILLFLIGIVVGFRWVRMWGLESDEEMTS